MSKKEVAEQLAEAKARISELERDAKAAEVTISLLIAQRDQADQVAARAKEALEQGRQPFSIEALLEMEEPAVAAALDWPSGPNSDAMKAALRNASHGIAHVRKTIATLESVNA